MLAFNRCFFVYFLYGFSRFSVQTFKSIGQLYLPQLKIFYFQFHSKANRGEFTRPKKESLRLNAMTAAKTLQFLSSLKQANLFTVAHASQNTFQRDEDVPIWTSVLTQKMHGQGEEAILKAKKRKSQPAFSKNISVKKLQKSDLTGYALENEWFAGSVISIHVNPETRILVFSMSLANKC